MMQDVTKNALLGISPLANRNIFQCYHSPSYLYGLDTIHVNQTDITRLEVKFREELRRMLGLPLHSPSCSVYLLIGTLPAEAMRDLDILGLLGQVAMCSEDQQYVSDIIRNNLEDYDESFAGWSSLARKTTAKYSLPDPQSYMQYPWIPGRWRSHCKSVIVETWDNKLRQEAATKSSLYLMDTSSLSTETPHKIYQFAGLDSNNVRKSTAQVWFLTGSYHTNERLSKMGKIKSPLCDSCHSVQNIPHMLLYCCEFSEMRQKFISEISQLNPAIFDFLRNRSIKIFSDQIILRIFLDPESPSLPCEISTGWINLSQVYQLCRDLCWNMHSKREKSILKKAKN